MKTVLQARYDRRKDFYGKAQVITEGNVIKLQSYDTIVAEITDSKPTIHGWYSATTARHINEFLRQNDFDAMSKKEMEESK